MVWTYTWAAIFFLFCFLFLHLDMVVYTCVCMALCVCVCVTQVCFLSICIPLLWPEKRTLYLRQSSNTHAGTHVYTHGHNSTHTHAHTRTPKLLESFRRRKWHTRGPQIQCSKLTNREHLRVMWSKEIKTYLTEKWSDKSHICYNDLSARHEDWNVVHKMAAS